jgi:hypothetical protein
MSSPSQDVLDRLSRVTSKLDAMADYQYHKAKRDIAEWKRADSVAEDWRRDTMRKHADRCGEHQVRYDSMFEPFGKRAPQPEADDFPPTYRRDLFRVGQSMLPSDHDLVGFDPNDLDGTVIAPMEEKLFEALRQQAEEPTGDNVPQSPWDPKARREVFDDSLQRKIVTYVAKESFIKAMNRPGMRAFFYTPDTVLGRKINWGSGARNWRDGF